MLIGLAVAVARRDRAGPAARPAAAPGRGRRARDGRRPPATSGSRRRDRPRSPRSRTRSTRCPARWRPARAGSATSCCPSRTSCAPRSPRSPASPSRSPTASPPATTCGRSGGPCSARPAGWTGWSATCWTWPGWARQDFRIDRQPVDLTALVGSAARRLAGPLRGGRRRLPGRRCRRDRWSLVTDPTRVRQILDGLAENALRVTPAGAPVVLALAEPTRPAVLQVRDGGPGPDPGRLRGRVRAVGALRALPGRPPGRHRRRPRPGARADHPARRHRGGRPRARGRRLLHRPAAAARPGPVRPTTTPIPTAYGGPVFGGGSGAGRRGR